MNEVRVFKIYINNNICYTLHEKPILRHIEGFQFYEFKDEKTNNIVTVPANIAVVVEVTE